MDTISRQKVLFKNIEGGGQNEMEGESFFAKGGGRETAWLKQKDAKSAGNFGEISLLRTDNSEFNRDEVLEILDNDQDNLVGVESKGLGISNPHWQKIKAVQAELNGDLDEKIQREDGHHAIYFW